MWVWVFALVASGRDSDLLRAVAFTAAASVEMAGLARASAQETADQRRVLGLTWLLPLVVVALAASGLWAALEWEATSRQKPLLVPALASAPHRILGPEPAAASAASPLAAVSGASVLVRAAWAVRVPSPALAGPRRLRRHLRAGFLALSVAAPPRHPRRLEALELGQAQAAAREGASARASVSRVAVSAAVAPLDWEVPTPLAWDRSAVHPAAGQRRHLSPTTADILTAPNSERPAMLQNSRLCTLGGRPCSPDAWRE